jgi:hypothetical protein
MGANATNFQVCGVLAMEPPFMPLLIAIAIPRRVEQAFMPLLIAINPSQSGAGIHACGFCLDKYRL